MPIPTPEQVQAAVAVLTMLGTMLAGLGAFTWKVTRRIHTLLEAQAATLAAVDKLRLQVVHTGKLTRERLDLFAKDVEGIKLKMAELAILVAEREKDVARLEGGMDQLGGLLVKNVAAINQTTGSLTKLWETLHGLFPEDVPKRLSDRRG